MSRYLKLSMVAILALVCIVPAASARPPFYVRGYFGPAYYGPAYYGWYGPGWGAPYGPYGYYGYVGGPAMGSVKIDTKMKDASVYVDGGYVGTVGQLKTFRLKPGAHDVEVRDHSGNSFYRGQVDVIAGKTVKIVP